MGEKIYEIEELKALTDQELKTCLADSWNIKNGQFDVWGNIKLVKNNK